MAILLPDCRCFGIKPGGVGLDLESPLDASQGIDVVVLESVEVSEQVVVVGNGGIDRHEPLGQGDLRFKATFIRKVGL